jgi:hypothetical protein
MMRRQCLHERFGQVVQQMTAVGNLHGMRRRTRCRLGVQAGAIPADHLRPRVCTYRKMKALGISVRE